MGNDTTLELVKQLKELGKKALQNVKNNPRLNDYVLPADTATATVKTAEPTRPAER
jgi:hypothetical protein